MNYCFSIDALSAAADKAWRLLNNGHWRPCSYAGPLQDQDARILDKSEAQYWIGRRMKKDEQTVLSPRHKAGRFDFLMRGIFTHVLLHRFTPAPLPDRQQMQACIAGLEPGTPWLLFLDVSGHFRALDTGKKTIIDNLDIAVRGEIASSPNYVGPRASSNGSMMDELYHRFLGGWLQHLNSSGMNVFIPDANRLEAEEKQIQAIRNWQHEKE